MGVIKSFQSSTLLNDEVARDCDDRSLNKQVHHECVIVDSLYKDV
jgi:hypothetical protein